MKVLVVDDDPGAAATVDGILSRGGYSVAVVSDGIAALARFRTQPFDAIVTAWMMPEMDGIELIRRIREESGPRPLIVMTSRIAAAEARAYALRTGADAFLLAPVSPFELTDLLRNKGVRGSAGVGAAFPGQPVARADSPLYPRPPQARIPPFAAVALGTSTGGPRALTTVLRALEVSGSYAGFITIHGPDWMQHHCAELLRIEQPALKFLVATHGAPIEAGCMYLAPGDRHLVVNAKTFTLALLDGPLVNFVRPAADPLFGSVAAAFGRYCVGVILTGLGNDGARGLAEIVRAGGRALIEAPATAIASYMPRAAIAAVGARGQVAELGELGRLLSQQARDVAEQCRLDQQAGDVGVRPRS